MNVLVEIFAILSVCDGPPFEVSERVMASFTLPIDIHFRNQEDDEPKKIRFEYNLSIPSNEGVNSSRLEKMSFHNQNEEFKKKVIKAGGVCICVLIVLNKLTMYL